MRSVAAVKYFAGVFFWLSTPVCAQVVASGTVREAGSGQPLQFVNVFLSGSTIGTTTSAEGTFTFSVPQPGKYELVASFVGYESFKRIVYFEKDSVFQFNILLREKATELAGITVLADSAAFKKNLREFRRLFVGETPNAQACKIMNPSSIYVQFDKKKHVLSAKSTSPIIIENNATGYRIHYALDRFEFDYDQKTISYIGTARFEDLTPSSNRVMNRWKKNRVKTYEGSITHLLRCIQANRLIENGWDVMMHTNQGFIHGKELMSGADPNEMNFRGKIYATYTKKTDPRAPPVYKRGVGMVRPSQYSEIEFLETPLRLFENGYYEPQTSVVLNGYLGWSQRVSELLPLGYEANR